LRSTKERFLARTADLEAVNLISAQPLADTSISVSEPSPFLE
jgi:hypothetical protein